ncbi:MAG: radical SAM protein [Ignavibacteriales bacterium]|nr:radical SAM protein [Ignavibacteriales bacterium]
MQKPDNITFLSPYKVCQHLDRLKCWMARESVSPITASFDMTLLCSHHCPHCPYRKITIKESFAKWSNIKKALTNLSNVGIRGVLFTGGGEPLENPFTLRAIEFSRSLNMETAIITNGYHLEPQISSVLLRNCQWIRISIDSATPSIYRLMHGTPVGIFDKILNNIRILVERKKIYRSTTTLGISMLTTQHNLSEMEAFVHLGGELGIDYCQFRPPQNPSREDKVAHKKSLAENIEICSSYSNGSMRVIASIDKYNKLMNREQRNSNCFAPHFVIMVGADGNTYLCPHQRYKKKYCTGSILENDWFQRRNRLLNATIRMVGNGDCPFLCKYDQLNKLLTTLDIKPEHLNFI